MCLQKQGHAGRIVGEEKESKAYTCMHERGPARNGGRGELLPAARGGGGASKGAAGGGRAPLPQQATPGISSELRLKYRHSLTHIDGPGSKVVTGKEGGLQCDCVTCETSRVPLRKGAHPTGPARGPPSVPCGRRTGGPRWSPGPTRPGSAPQVRPFQASKVAESVNWHSDGAPGRGEAGVGRVAGIDLPQRGHNVEFSKPFPQPSS